MCKNTLLPAALGMAFILSIPAHGATVDTFSFTENGWSEYSLLSGAAAPLSDTIVTGTFSGVLEPDGFIELGDLTQFSVQFYFPGSSVYSFSQPALTLFSYDTAPGGGPSSLDFAGTLDDPANICIGAATSLDPNCAYLGRAYPPGTLGTVQLNTGVVDYVSSTAPQITLVSSVGSSATAPEPASIFLECIGLAVIGILGRRSLA